MKITSKQQFQAAICMTPACATWCTKWWICGWSYWLGTSSTLVYHDHIVFSSCMLCLQLLCFAWCNFWKITFHKVV